MITDYASLQTSVADWSYRTDMTARIPEFIQLCESDMQIRCKLVDLEGIATVAITAGTGTLPTDFSGMRSVYWDGDLARPLKYLPPDRFDVAANQSGTGIYYTITGSSILVAPQTDGNVVMTYKARFAPLSGSNTTNVILEKYPDAYLHGTLLQLANFVKDTAAMGQRGVLYEAAINRIKSDNAQRKHAGPLEVRAS